MVEPPQPPFERRHRPQIIGGGEADHRHEPGEIDCDRHDLGKRTVRGDDDERRGPADRERDAEDVDDRVGERLGAQGPTLPDEPGRERLEQGELVDVGGHRR